MSTFRLSQQLNNSTNDTSISSSEQIELRKKELDFEMRKYEIDAALQIRKSLLDFEKFKYSHHEERRVQREIKELIKDMAQHCDSNDYDLNCNLNLSNLISKVKLGFNVKKSNSMRSLCNEFHNLDHLRIRKLLSADSSLSSQSLVSDTPTFNTLDSVNNDKCCQSSSKPASECSNSVVINSEKIARLKKLLSSLGKSKRSNGYETD